jgi:hypothetical protein
VSYFLFQKKPDGASKWDDEDGRIYNFSKALPRATRVSKHDHLLFYRPAKAGTPEDGCVYAAAVVGLLEIDGKNVLARLQDYLVFGNVVPLTEVGDPRDNPQLSLQPVDRDWFEKVLRRAGLAEGADAGG